MICPKCGKYYNDAHIFCPFCKTKKPIKVCPKCGEIGEDEDNFCTMCGSKLIKIDYEKNILKEKLNDFKEANKKLQTETQTLKKQNIKLENENIGLKQTNKEQEEKLLKTEEELNNLNESNEKLQTETQEVKVQNTKLKKEMKFSLETYLNSRFNDSKYDSIRKFLLENIISGKITNIEQIDTKIKKYELKKYLNEKCNNEEWKNKILTRIENRKITTKKRIDIEIGMLEKEYMLKLQREELISYVNKKINKPAQRVFLKMEIDKGTITKKEQIDKKIKNMRRNKSGGSAIGGYTGSSSGRRGGEVLPDNSHYIGD